LTKVVVTAELRPSEDVDKVKVAIANFFDYTTIRREKGGRFEVLIAESETLKS
jgi:Protein of unknown function DUF54.